METKLLIIKKPSLIDFSYLTSLLKFSDSRYKLEKEKMLQEQKYKFDINKYR